MARLPPLVSMIELRAAIAARRVISIWHHGEQLELEPHALVQAVKTHALVLAARKPSDPEGPWCYYRFADIRGFKLCDGVFSGRSDVPAFVPAARTNKTAN